MRVVKPVLKLLVLLSVLAVMILMFRPVYTRDGTINWVLAWIIIGCPFGIRKMFAVCVPHGFDLGGTVGVLGLNLIVGGLIGGVVVVIDIIKCLVGIVQGICLCFS